MIKIIQKNKLGVKKLLKKYAVFLSFSALALLTGITFMLANSNESLDDRSQAAVGDSKHILFTNEREVPVTDTKTTFVNVTLTSPWPKATALLNYENAEVAGEQTTLGQHTAVFKVESSSDDVNVDGNNMNTRANSTWIGTGRSSNNSWTGYRFNNVTIPKGAQIISAKLRVYSTTTQWITHTYRIYGENVGNSATFTNNSKPNQRSLTSSSVAHNSNTRWGRRTWISLDEMRQVVQQIVNRSDWNQGNSMSILLKGSGGPWGRKFVAGYDSSSEFAPQLVVTYETDDSPQRPTPTLSVSASPLPVSPTRIIVTERPLPTVEPTTVSVELAEDSNFTINKTTVAYNSHPVKATYTFSNSNPGRKTLYARFISSTGQTQVFSNWIDLVPSPTSTPIPTTPPSGGGNGENSHAMGKWVPDPRYDTCTVAEHDSYKAKGPDGKWYPTWHPPVHTRPDGSQCTFGHEHGRDPKGSNLLAFATEEYGGILFGYANEQLDIYNAANNINNGMRHEDHVGHKIEWENNLRMSVNKCNRPASDGCFDTVETNITCNFLMKIHQGTHSADAFTNNVHELAYFVSCNDGTKIASTKMVAFGRPGEFIDTCSKSRTIRVGAANPANSPTGNGMRFIGDKTCVDQHILVPSNQWSQYSLGLYEDWVSSNYLRKPDGTDIAYFDPHFAVFGPSRYYDPTKPNNVGYSIDVCYMKEANGDRARGGDCEFYTDYKDGSTIPVNQRIKFDDPRSGFNGVGREFYFNQTWIRNLNGPTTWYTDPYGNRAANIPFTGSVKHYVAPIDNYNKTIFESAAMGADRWYGGNGVHAPN